MATETETLVQTRVVDFLGFCFVGGCFSWNAKEIWICLMVQSIKSPMNILSKNFLVNFPDEKVDWFSEIWRVREWFDVTDLVFYWVEECDLKYFFVGHSVQLKRPLSPFKQNHRKWFSLSDKSQICADNMSGLSFCPPYFLTTHPQQLIKQSFLSLNHSPASVQSSQTRAIIHNPTDDNRNRIRNILHISFDNMEGAWKM